MGSSDRPVTVGASLRSIQCMVEWLSQSGLPVGLDDAVSVEDTLRAFTMDAAYACHREDSLGSIAPGRHADFVVLGDGPTAVGPSRIGDIEVVATAVAGEIAHGERLW